MQHRSYLRRTSAGTRAGPASRTRAQRGWGEGHCQARWHDSEVAELRSASQPRSAARAYRWWVSSTLSPTGWSSRALRAVDRCPAAEWGGRRPRLPDPVVWWTAASMADRSAQSRCGPGRDGAAWFPCTCTDRAHRSGRPCGRRR